MMDGPERLPVQEAQRPLRTQRAHLHELALGDAIPDPGVARRPSVATQYQRPRVAGHDGPPVDAHTRDERLRTFELPPLAQQAPAGDARTPQAGDAVPREVTTDTREVSADSHGQIVGKHDRDPFRV